MIFECQPNTADALSVILNRENISCYHGLGPGCIAIEVVKRDEKRARKVIEQWKIAVDALYNQTQQVK